MICYHHSCQTFKSKKMAKINAHFCLGVPQKFQKRSIRGTPVQSLVFMYDFRKCPSEVHLLESIISDKGLYKVHLFKGIISEEVHPRYTFFSIISKRPIRNYTFYHSCCKVLKIFKFKSPIGNCTQ